MYGNFMMKKGLFKERGQQKEKRDNLDDYEKEHRKENMRKRKRRLCMITLTLVKKNKLEKMIKKRKIDKCLET